MTYFKIILSALALVACALIGYGVYRLDSPLAALLIGGVTLILVIIVLAVITAGNLLGEFDQKKGDR